MLPPLMLLIAWLMVSNIYYPSFKKVDWNTQTKWGTFLIAMTILSLVALLRDIALAVIFSAMFSLEYLDTWRGKNIFKKMPSLIEVLKFSEPFYKTEVL
jgi:phosphatidylserine synthase